MKKDDRENSKNKIQKIPLPPLFMKELHQYILDRGLQEDDHLLYGLKGTPLENKQYNYIVNVLCDHLNWKDEKRFTPQGLRYTISTLFHEAGVSEASIRYLLGHSQYELGNLR